jgi:hypothetical protein
MNRENLQTAINEAERFLMKAKAVKFHQLGGWVDSDHYALSAACKRASMDLTKALSVIRRP